MSVTTNSTNFSTSNDVVYIGDSQLADDTDGPPFIIHGVALGAGDVTTGESGIEKFWPADELQDAAETLEGQALVEDHNNSARGVVGEVVKAGYKDGVGVIYEAELDDEELAEKIDNGRLEVSVRGFHKSVDELDETDDGAKKVEDIVFDNLSIVRSGASPSNTVNMGEHDELSAAVLSEYTAALETDDSFEPADYVKWDGGRGIVFQVDGDEATVEVMEESDGMWRATGDEKTVPMSDLSEWDVDEEEDIGAPKDDESDDEDESDEDDMDEEEAGTRPEDFVFDSEQRAIDFIEDRPGLTGVHVHVMDDTRKYMPGADMKEFMEWFESLQEMQNAQDDYSKGDWVKGESSGGMWHGQIVEVKTSGSFDEQIDGDFTIDATEDNPAALIEIYDGSEPTGTMVGHRFDGIESWDGPSEEENVDEEPPEFEEGDMVRWQVEPDLFGKVVHNPDDEPVIMVEIMDRTDGGMETTHHTISAYPSDIVPMEEDMMSVEDVEILDELEDSDELDEVYSEWEDAVNMTASELRQWSKNPCSRQASVEPVDVIRRNLRLLERSKDEWTDDDIQDAKRTISFVSRMSDSSNEPESPKDGPHGCPSEWAISLLNWAHNPFESIPEHPDDSDLESVDEVTLDEFRRTEGAEESVDGEDKCNQPHRYPDHTCDKCSEELQEYEWHEPSWSGTTESEWSTPDYSEFQDEYDFEENFADLSEEDKSTVANHFLIAQGGFPGENYGSLKLPVVEPSGELSLNALIAVKGGRGVSAVEGLSSEMEKKLIGWVNSTANEEFDKDWSMDEEENMDVDGENKYETARRMLEDFLDIEGNSMDSSIKAFDGHATMDRVSEVIQEYLRKNDDSSMESPVSEFSRWLSDMSTQSKHGDEEEEMSVPDVQILTGDDLRQAYNGASVAVAAADISTTGDTTMDDKLEAELSKLDEPTAVEQDTLEELRDKAEKYENMEEDIASLRERTEVLDEADRDAVEELAETEDPVVLESAEYEQLSAEADEVARVYAEKISEDTPFDAEELAEKYDIGELREKFEEMGHSTEELASAEETDPAPKSTDADEEELEDAAEDEESDEAELAEDVAQAQKEMAERIGIDFDTGGD